MDEEPLIQKEIHGTYSLKHPTKEVTQVPHKDRAQNEQCILRKDFRKQLPSYEDIRKGNPSWKEAFN